MYINNKKNQKTIATFPKMSYSKSIEYFQNKAQSSKK